MDAEVRRPSVLTGGRSVPGGSRRMPPPRVPTCLCGAPGDGDSLPAQVRLASWPRLSYLGSPRFRTPSLCDMEVCWRMEASSQTSCSEASGSC